MNTAVSFTKVLCKVYIISTPKPRAAEIQGDSQEGTELREDGRSVTAEILGCSNQLLGKKLKLIKYTKQS